MRIAANLGVTPLDIQLDRERAMRIGGKFGAVGGRLSQNRRTLVVAPFYKAEHLVERLVSSLIASAADLTAIGADVLLVNDSPDYAPLGEALAAAGARAAEAGLACRIVTNERNLGFVGTVNLSIREAVASGADIILLNSDTIVFAGALKEMVDVAYSDEMIGFVSPRSNNATLCSLPQQEERWRATPAEGYLNYAAIAPRLPRFTYAPTVVGFCMLIKWRLLNEFGDFDPIYGAGYNEENDFVCRAGMVGYRGALANRAYVWHEGEQSFSLSGTPKAERERKNSAILLARYPHYSRLVSAYFASPAYRAERVLGGLLRNYAGKHAIAFDFSTFAAHHNGTFEAAKALAREAAAAWSDAYDVAVIASQAVFEFHKLGAIAGLRRVDIASDEVFAAVIRIGQPFDWESVDRLAARAPVIAISMLDTIAQDCGPLFRQEVEELWAFASEQVDVLLTISQYSMDQFSSRYPVSDRAVRCASLLSVDIEDYAPVEIDAAFAADCDGAIFIIGNHFPHKHVAPTLERLLEAAPDARFVTIGIESDNPRVVSFAAGLMTDAQVASLYSRSRLVVFPSFYEGFGLPLLHALAHRKPVIARRMPVFEEIVAAMGGSPNVHLFESTQEMAEAAASGDIVWRPQPISSGQGWARSAAEIRGAVEQAIGAIDARRVEARFRALDLRRAERAGAVHAAPAPPAPLLTREEGAARAAGRLAEQLAGRIFAIGPVFGAARGLWHGAKRLKGAPRAR